MKIYQLLLISVALAVASALALPRIPSEVLDQLVNDATVGRVLRADEPIVPVRIPYISTEHFSAERTNSSSQFNAEICVPRDNDSASCFEITCSVVSMRPAAGYSNIAWRPLQLGNCGGSDSSLGNYICVSPFTKTECRDKDGRLQIGGRIKPDITVGLFPGTDKTVIDCMRSRWVTLDKSSSQIKPPSIGSPESLSFTIRCDPYQPKLTAFGCVAGGIYDDESELCRTKMSATLKYIAQLEDRESERYTQQLARHTQQMQRHDAVHTQQMQQYQEDKKMLRQAIVSLRSPPATILPVGLSSSRNDSIIE